MKKLIVLAGVLLVCVLGVFAGSSYLRGRQIENQEVYTRHFMQDKFAQFVKTWDVSMVPTLYIENAQVNEIAKLLVQIKNKLGSCTLEDVPYCESQERHADTRKDEYYTDKGYSVRCPMVLSCEKEKHVTGTTIFYPDGIITKLFAFSVTFGE